MAAHTSEHIFDTEHFGVKLGRKCHFCSSPSWRSFAKKMTKCKACHVYAHKRCLPRTDKVSVRPMIDVATMAEIKTTSCGTHTVEVQDACTGTDAIQVLDAIQVPDASSWTDARDDRPIDASSAAAAGDDDLATIIKAFTELVPIEKRHPSTTAKFFKAYAVEKEEEDVSTKLFRTFADVNDAVASEIIAPTVVLIAAAQNIFSRFCGYFF